jgi:hypothetical protein
MRQRANWLGWVLQAVFGFFVGGFAGFALIARLRLGPRFYDDLLFPFVIGSALIGAGLGSRYGDRLWLGDNYRELAPDEPEQSNLSEILSWCLFAAGLATCIVTILRQFGAL